MDAYEDCRWFYEADAYAFVGRLRSCGGAKVGFQIGRCFGILRSAGGFLKGKVVGKGVC